MGILDWVKAAFPNVPWPNVLGNRTGAKYSIRDNISAFSGNVSFPDLYTVEIRLPDGSVDFHAAYTWTYYLYTMNSNGTVANVRGPYTMSPGEWPGYGHLDRWTGSAWYWKVVQTSPRGSVPAN